MAIWKVARLCLSWLLKSKWWATHRKQKLKATTYPIFIRELTRYQSIQAFSSHYCNSYGFYMSNRRLPMNSPGGRQRHQLCWRLAPAPVRPSHVRKFFNAPGLGWEFVRSHWRWTYLLQTTNRDTRRWRAQGTYFPSTSWGIWGPYSRALKPHYRSMEKKFVTEFIF